MLWAFPGENPSFPSSESLLEDDAKVTLGYVHE